MTTAEIIEEQKAETREIIEALLADGSDPDALYTIEHHLSADRFDQLEGAAVEAFKLGFDVSEAEELELDDGSKVICFDAVMESALDADRIDAQAEQLVALADKHGIEYDGWGTYFESDEDGEEGDDSSDEDA
ncbi:ribonuclease E inhibitor RraB [Veronia nyctiphanis]|uniref:Regulator of ribonuclease activity B n=1 Tax=Veronia nyctiphanis TaxID=1278244 RepID=A0A4Q0YIL2_9GAMM|nr:ribonuclease E inhibitor RraB [Veronia nyctiphanis]RXJ70547.1 ribonuclease E inhibitor RraB [Veronia nyctiphanis]